MGTNTMKIQYLSTDFVGKTLESQEIDESELSENLMQYFNHDLVLMPFVQTLEKKRAVLVSVKILDNQVYLFDKEVRDEDSKYFYWVLICVF